MKADARASQQFLLLTHLYSQKADAAALARLRKELLRPKYTALELTLGSVVGITAVGGDLFCIEQFLLPADFCVVCNSMPVFLFCLLSSTSFAILASQWLLLYAFSKCLLSNDSRVGSGCHCCWSYFTLLSYSMCNSPVMECCCPQSACS